MDEFTNLPQLDLSISGERMDSILPFYLCVKISTNIFFISSKLEYSLFSIRNLRLKDRLKGLEFLLILLDQLVLGLDFFLHSLKSS